MQRFLTASFDKPLVAIVLALAGAALGAVWMRGLPRDVFPDLSAPSCPIRACPGCTARPACR